MVIQRVFSKSNSDKLYLSPYVLTSIESNNLFITREDRKKIIKLTTKENPLLILKTMNDGIIPNDFLKVLADQLVMEEKQAKDVLQLLVSEKILD